MRDISNIDLSNKMTHFAAMTDTETVDLDIHLPALIFALGSKISLHAQRENARTLGVDMCEWRTIQILGRDGKSTINQIADRISMDRGGTSRAVSRLESRGLAERQSAKGDRRKSVIDLTDRGRQLHQEIAAFANAREERLTRILSETERAELDRMLRALTAEMDHMLETRWKPSLCEPV